MNDCKMSDSQVMAAILIPGLLLISLFAYGIFQSDTKEKAEREMRRTACKTLNAQFGETLYIKEGPYSKVAFKAIKFGDQAITVIPMQEFTIKELSEMQFTCDDFERRTDTPKPVFNGKRNYTYFHIGDCANHYFASSTNNKAFCQVTERQIKIVDIEDNQYVYKTYNSKTKQYESQESQPIDTLDFKYVQTKCKE